MLYFLFIELDFCLKPSNLVLFLYPILVTLLLGNLVVRIAYEFSLILLVICRNTTEIAKNTKKVEDKTEDK